MKKQNWKKYSSFSKNTIVAALDIGSSKVCCLIGKIENNNLTVVGAGFQESKGLVSGIITDMNALETSIRNCVASAEKMASIRIKTINIGFSAVNTIIENLNIEIDLKGAIISQGDLDRAYEFLSEKHSSVNKSILHVIPVQYSIDGNKGVKSPLGMFGDKLGVEISIISTEKNILKNFKNVVKQCDLEVGEIIYAPYAIGLNLLSEEEKELGIALVDIGATLSSLSIFYNGAILYTKIIPLGGNMITNDISRIFSLSLNDAERIKIINGQLIEELENSLSIIEVETLGDDNDSIEITRKDLISVIKPRVNEIINSIKDQIIESDYSNIITNKIVITGGSSQMDGLIDIASKIIDKKGRLAKATAIKGIPENMRNSSFTTVNSLLNYSIINANDITIQGNKKNITSESFYSYFVKFKRWIFENF